MDQIIPVSQVVTLQNLVVILVIQGVLEAIKATLRKLKVLDKKGIQIILPYSPMLLGAAIAFIPGALVADSLGARIMLGVALGAIGGQVWKIFHTKISVLKGKV